MNFSDHQPLALGPIVAIALLGLTSSGCETPTNDVGMEPQAQASVSAPSATASSEAPAEFTDREAAVEAPALPDAAVVSDVDTPDALTTDASAPPSDEDDTVLTDDTGPTDAARSQGDIEFEADSAGGDEGDGVDQAAEDTAPEGGLGTAPPTDSGDQGDPLPKDCTGLDDDTLCDDGDLCTLDDTCREGVCTGTTLDCGDKDPCTEDEACVEGVCTATMWPDDKVCDGANGCAFAGTCQQGTCEPDTPLCVSDDPCKIGACVDELCVFESAANFTLCDDGDACTIYDRCISGYCFGSPMNCKDGEPCTVDSCSQDTGECESELIEDCVPGTPADFAAPDINPHSASYELETTLASFTGKILVGIFHSPS